MMHTALIIHFIKLALMEGPDFPIALGVIRVVAPTYNDCVYQQIEEVKQKKKNRTLKEYS